MSKRFKQRGKKEKKKEGGGETNTTPLRDSRAVSISDFVEKHTKP